MLANLKARSKLFHERLLWMKMRAKFYALQEIELKQQW